MKHLIIETNKLIENIEKIKLSTNSKIIAVVKGNGYGLGTLPFAKVLRDNGINFFAVTEIEDAVLLKNNLLESDVLFLPATSIYDQMAVLIENDIIISLGSFTQLEIIKDLQSDYDKPVRVHIKIDTGFGRYGFLPEEIDKLADVLINSDFLQIEGVYSHFSFAFEKGNKWTQKQFDIFIKCINKLKEKGVNCGILHIANSSAFLRFNNMHLDAVRVGSAFLGRLTIENRLKLNKIGYLRSIITEIKYLPKGHFVGYSNTYKTNRPKKIAIVPVGYKDGFGMSKANDTFRFIDILRYIYNDIKSFNKKLYVKINGKSAMVMGKIGMCNVVIDITNIDANVGDEVIFDVNPIYVNPNIERVYK